MGILDDYGTVQVISYTIIPTVSGPRDTEDFLMFEWAKAAPKVCLYEAHRATCALYKTPGFSLSSTAQKKASTDCCNFVFVQLGQ